MEKFGNTCVFCGDETEGYELLCQSCHDAAEEYSHQLDDDGVFVGESD